MASWKFWQRKKKPQPITDPGRLITTPDEIPQGYTEAAPPKDSGGRPGGRFARGVGSAFGAAAGAAKSAVGGVMGRFRKEEGPEDWMKEDRKREAREREKEWEKEQEELAWYVYGKKHIPGYESMEPKARQREIAKLFPGYSAKEIKRLPKEILKGEKEKAKMRLEAEAAGIAAEEVEYTKVYQQGYWYDPTTGKPVKEGTPGSEWHPGEWKIQAVKKPLSPFEAKFKTEFQKAQLEELRRQKTMRRVAPFLKIAEVVGRSSTPPVKIRREFIQQATPVRPGRPSTSPTLLIPRLPPADLSSLREAMLPKQQVGPPQRTGRRIPLIPRPFRGRRGV